MPLLPAGPLPALLGTDPLQDIESELHRAMVELANAAPGLSKGDVGCAELEVALREAQGHLLELCTVLADRWVAGDSWPRAVAAPCGPQCCAVAVGEGTAGPGLVVDGWVHAPL